MKERRLRSMYLIGIGLNAIALAYAAADGAVFFAATFAFVVVYLGIRYWMITS